MRKITTLFFMCAAFLANSQISTTLYEYNASVGNQIGSGDTIYITENSGHYNFKFKVDVTGNSADVSTKILVKQISSNSCFTYQLCSELTPDNDFQNTCWDITSTNWMSPTLTNIDPASVDIIYNPKGDISCSGCTQIRYVVYVDDVVMDSVDYMICNTLSTPTNTKEASSLSVYPNPVNSTLTVATAGMNGSLDVRVTDVLGKVVFKESFASGTKTIDVSDFKNGVYLVTVLENGSIVQTRRVVVRH